MVRKAQIECPKCGMNTAEEREGGGLYCLACNTRTNPNWCGESGCERCQGYDFGPKGSPDCPDAEA